MLTMTLTFADEFGRPLDEADILRRVTIDAGMQSILVRREPDAVGVSARVLRDTLDVLDDVAEYLDNYSDVVDGAYGEMRPNRAMRLGQRVEESAERLAFLRPPAAIPPVVTVRND